ncbi:STAS domain-containing protein [Dactylosporangium sp. AC04546]|uniref:STAS domain-containing protein n=1 Tax=Dactylosporangium sp. AC04546 TaxID=2862460 RepID=UPI001EE0D1A5|nr:STAS domain-containing protein [Dactylosporangium sp. AC04546]WVK81906.1 STAS domain-containing protein [Dactylosporangium sp. AC04546]
MSSDRTPVVLALHGLLVEGTVATVEPVLAGCLGAHEPRLVLDVSQVTVCDTVGAALLVSVAEVARGRGGEVRLADPSPAIRSWLGVAAGMSAIAVFATVEGAVEADPRDLLAGAPPPVANCVDERPAPRSRRPRWRVNPSGRARSRRGPASPRR